MLLGLKDLRKTMGNFYDAANETFDQGENIVILAGGNFCL